MALDFEQVYKEHFTDVYKYVLFLSRNATVAEEVTQETFFKAMQKIDQFNGSCKLHIWLIRISRYTKSRDGILGATILFCPILRWILRKIISTRTL